MTLEEWSDSILLVKLPPEPTLTEDLNALEERLATPVRDVVLDFAQITTLNSTHLAQLLRIRKLSIEGDRDLRLCGLNDGIWGVFLVTGLDKIFTFAEDVPTALASLQIDQ